MTKPAISIGGSLGFCTGIRAAREDKESLAKVVVELLEVGEDPSMVVKRSRRR